VERLITTSWDDGHEADFRLADLLEKYNVKATFYIPKTNAERKVMPARMVRELADRFEVGGHTLQHVRLHNRSSKIIADEINGSYHWLSNLTGKAPVSFCFPGGKYNQQAILQAHASGFRVLRTTELLSIVGSQAQGLVPTTLQLFQHTKATYFKHLVKHRRWSNLLTWIKASGLVTLEKLTEYYLVNIERSGGCFHLWGHSWEIEENNLWDELEIILKHISNRTGFTYIENKEILSL
jgi:hypothetical protein